MTESKTFIYCLKMIVSITVLYISAFGFDYVTCSTQYVFDDSQPKPKFTLTSDFSNVVKVVAHVDKSSLIEELIDSHEMVLVESPKGYGKSTNMDMFKRFCEIRVDESGKPIDREDTENYKIFSGQYVDYDSKALEIFKSKTFFNFHFGVYPVVHLSLKILSFNKFDDYLFGLKTVLRDLYTSHRYLLQSSALDEKDKGEFNRYFLREHSTSMRYLDVILGIKVLTSFLFKHFEKKVIVLIDDTDASLVHPSAQINSSLRHELADLLKTLLTATLESNSAVERALVNSDTTISKTVNVECLEPINSPTANSLLKYYGLTRNEVDGLITKFNLPRKRTAMLIQQWYGDRDGYPTLVGRNSVRCNTFMVIDYLRYITAYGSNFTRKVETSSDFTIG